MITLNKMYEEIVKIYKLEGLAEDIRTPVEILERIGQEELERLAKSPKKDLAEQARIPNTVIFNLAANPSTPVEILKKIAEKAENEQKRTRGFPSFAFRLKSSLARNPSTPVELLEKWVEDERCFVRKCIAQNPSTPTEILEKIAYNEYWEYTEKGKREELLAPVDELEGLARNPSTPVKILEKLAENDDYVIKSTLANNPSTPVKILEKLAQDEEQLIRFFVAMNESTPIAILKKLAKDEVKSVRSAVAANSSAPEDILKEFAQEGDFERNLARNPSTPVEILERLAEEELEKLEIDESEEAIVNVESASLISIFNLASNPSTPLQTLEKLRQLAERLGETKDTQKLKAQLALNPSTPIEILEDLLQDKKMYIYLIRNPVIQTLARENDEAQYKSELVGEIKELIEQERNLEQQIKLEAEHKQGDSSREVNE